MNLVLSNVKVIVITAIFLALTANLSFFQQAMAIYPLGEHLFFLGSLLLLLFALTTFLLSLMSLVLTARVAATLFIVVAAVAAYFTDKFGTVIDADMIRNSLETNMAESSDLASINLGLRFLLLGILPIILLWRLPYRSSPILKHIFVITIVGVASLVLAVANIGVFSSQYASFFREHKSVRYYANPGYPLYSFGSYLASFLKSPPPTELLSLQANARVVENDQHSELVILVVGETARADHFSLNGYERDTNPLLAQEPDLISYAKMSSCGTSTAISVPCMFAYSGRANFNVNKAKYTENILDVLQQAGVSVLWRDNNSSSKGVSARIPTEDYRSPSVNPECDVECRDVGMLDGLQAYIDRQTGDTLIVLHQMGSHGPAYYKSYPKYFEHFTPVCASNELAQCSQQEIINTYDNTIRYTDYFLSQVIRLLKKNTDRFETSMLYMSDHGESLGENGLYLHGMPYAMAPDAQTKVPVILWSTETSDMDLMKTSAMRNEVNSHDVLFDTLLTLFEVNSDLAATSESPLLYIRENDVPR